MYLAISSTTNFNDVLVSGNKATIIANGVAYETGALMNGLPAGLTDKDDLGGTPVKVA